MKPETKEGIKLLLAILSIGFLIYSLFPTINILDYILKVKDTFSCVIPIWLVFILQIESVFTLQMVLNPYESIGLNQINSILIISVAWITLATIGFVIYFFNVSIWIGIFWFVIGAAAIAGFFGLNYLYGNIIGEL